MEATAQAGAEYLIQTYGLAGLVIIGLVVVIWRMAKLADTRQTRMDALHDKRVEEARESVKALEANTDAMTRLTELIRDRLRPLS